MTQSESTSPKFLWNGAAQGQLHSCYFYGYMVTQVFIFHQVKEEGHRVLYSVYFDRSWGPISDDASDKFAYSDFVLSGLQHSQSFSHLLSLDWDILQLS